jgi:hypothetical protein
MRGYLTAVTGLALLAGCEGPRDPDAPAAADFDPVEAAIARGQLSGGAARVLRLLPALPADASLAEAVAHLGLAGPPSESFAVTGGVCHYWPVDTGYEVAISIGGVSPGSGKPDRVTCVRVLHLTGSPEPDGAVYPIGTWRGMKYKAAGPPNDWLAAEGAGGK